MLIGIDGNEANIKNRVGVNVYAFELFWGLYKIAQRSKPPIAFRIYLKQKPLDDMPPETDFWSYRLLESGKVWILSKLMPDLYSFSPKPDILFTPNHYVPLLSPVPRVCSIMDLGYLKFTGQFRKYDYWQLKLWTAYSLFVSNCVISISNTTKRDIVRHYPFTSKKIKVTLLGYDKNKFNINSSNSNVRHTKKKYHIVNDYVLYVGTLKPSKNIGGLIDAWSKINTKFPNLKLVIAGKKGWLYEDIFEKTKQLGLESKIIFTDFISEEDKISLMKGAKLFILPSFWEGFGLDALNALASGTPVVATNQGSVPEVVGDAAILIDPYDIDSIANGIEKVINMSKIEYNKLVERGLTKANEYSWDKTAEETINIFMEVVK